MKWEYRTAKFDYYNFFSENSKFRTEDFDEILDRFGADGWELVSTQGIVSYGLNENPYTKMVILFFKRPLNE